MKKILKLLFALSTVTALPLSVTACKQESLDSTLRIIYEGNTKYDLNQFLEESMDATIAEKTLSIEKSEELAKKIAEQILTDNEITTPINWFNSNLPINQQCYNFAITNGKVEGNNRTWDVKAIDERFTINISYMVGSVNQNHEFEAKQKINMSFNIKAGTSASDKQVKTWVNNFNQKITGTIEVNLTSKKIDIPKNGTQWSAVNQAVITEIYQTIDNILNDNTVTWSIENKNPTIANNEMSLEVIAKLNDAKLNTNVFTIKFV